jgi:transcriptional regulator with XRE-family HTH domain
LVALGEEIRIARLAAGLSLAVVADAAGISAGELSRIERGLAPWLSLLMAARVCAVVGLDLSVRAYAGGDPVRDAGHARLAELFRHRHGPGLVARSEVPVGDDRDQRAWDQTITDGATVVAVEFETRLSDAQALVRRVNLKRRDSGVDVVILVLNDTNANRRAALAARETLRSTFPLEPSEVLPVLAAGRLPTAGGVVFLRAIRATGAGPREPAQPSTLRPA